MSISAFTAPSGGYQTITATSNVPHRERARPYWTLHTVGNLSAVFALILAIVLPLLWYGYDVDPLLRGMALCAIAVLALIKAQVTVASRAAAEEGARTRAHFDRSIASIANEQATVTKTVRCIEVRLQRVSEIADLPEILNDRAAKHARLFLAEVQQLREAVDGRLGDLEQRVEEQECRIQERYEEYERGWVDGAAKTADALSGNSNGRVHQLRPR